ncbi:hypothetical protein C1Y40_04687 [Mycobacterium talmoniae]|uniref:Phosphatidic acid phosphatase type 2/haloperoxidase domain-containing protein n=1 Tax=Mycobacterium talmoniae TaxID=1858794 RepID=A0A2S8BES6_9MYCO|nr:hypothetical protein C1Y40_04687 [Mycobacterium talmoniae]
MPRQLPPSSRGIRQIAAGLGALDTEVFEAVATSHGPVLDTAMPALTRAADHSKLWLAIAAVMAATGNRSVRRGAGRGVASLAVTSLITNQLAKRVWRRQRPVLGSCPPRGGCCATRRRIRCRPGIRPAPPRSPSVSDWRTRRWACCWRRWRPGRVLPGATGAHYPGDVLAGFGIGAAIAGLGGRLVPPIVDRRLPSADRCARVMPISLSQTARSWS